MMFVDHIYNDKLATTTALSVAAWPRRFTSSGVIHSPRVKLAAIDKHKALECHFISSPGWSSGLRRHPMNRCY